MNKKIIEEFLNEYDKSIDGLAKEIIKEIKKESNNYKDFNERYTRFKKDVLWEFNSYGYKLSKCLFTRIEYLIEKEKNDLPLTNRSEFTNELSKEKLDWLNTIGVINISPFDYILKGTGHLYSKEYLNNNSLEEIKKQYDLLYSHRRNNNSFCYFCNNGKE